MQALIKSGVLSTIKIVSILVIVAGALLYWRISNGFQAAWMATGAGVAFTIGGLAGVLALVLGFIITEPSATRMARIGGAIQSQGSPPTPEQMGQLKVLQERVRLTGRINVGLLLVAAVLMIVGRTL